MNGNTFLFGKVQSERFSFRFWKKGEGKEKEIKQSFKQVPKKGAGGRVSVNPVQKMPGEKKKGGGAAI